MPQNITTLPELNKTLSVFNHGNSVKQVIMYEFADIKLTANLC